MIGQQPDRHTPRDQGRDELAQIIQETSVYHTAYYEAGEIADAILREGWVPRSVAARVADQEAGYDAPGESIARRLSNLQCDGDGTWFHDHGPVTT